MTPKLLFLLILDPTSILPVLCHLVFVYLNMRKGLGVNSMSYPDGKLIFSLKTILAIIQTNLLICGASRLNDSSVMAGLVFSGLK